MCAILVPDERKQRAMVGQVLDGEVRPIGGYQWLKDENVSKCWYYAEQISEDIIEVRRMQVVLAMVGRISGPHVDGRVVGLRSVRYA